MATRKLRSEELGGLGAAIAAHVALVALLVLRPPSPAPLPVPERMTVTLSDDAALTSTLPELAAKPAPDIAPTIGEPLVLAPPALPEPEIAPVVKPLPKAGPVPPPRPVTRIVPRPPVVSKPAAKIPTRPVASSAPRRPTTPASAPQRPTALAGGSRIGNDFLKGVSGTKAAGAATAPNAATIGPQVRSALAGAISRQLKPRWTAPQGVDAEKLVTVLAWGLNRDGSLAGTPRVVRQEGINDANRAQAQRHAEQAVRAVQLAAPFNLPADYYDAWKRVADFKFDRRLSQ